MGAKFDTTCSCIYENEKLDKTCCNFWRKNIYLITLNTILWKTHDFNLTSASDLFNDIISEAIKLNWLILNFSFFSFSWLFGMLTGLPISPGKPCSPITVLAGDHLTRPLPLWSPLWCIWLLISDSSTLEEKILV